MNTSRKKDDALIHYAVVPESSMGESFQDRLLQEESWVNHPFFEQVPIGIFVLIANEVFAHVNTRLCTMLGYTADELLTHSLFSITHPDDRTVARQFFQHMWEGHRTGCVLEKRYMRKNGAFLWLRLTACLITFFPSNDPKCVVYCEDITALKEGELERSKREQQMMVVMNDMREKRQSMNEFLSLVIHELKSPLAIMKGNLQLLERRLRRLLVPVTGQQTSPETVETLVHVVDRQITRVDLLVGTLLDVSRIHVGRLQLCMTGCNLSYIVHSAIKSFLALMPGKQVVLLSSVPSTVWVQADAERIEQVLHQYLLNAATHAATSKPIELGMRISEQEVCVFVRDHGRGICHEEQQIIWDGFYRAQSSKREKDTNIDLGVGLYISRAIIEQHNGQVGVYSESGKGATFWFSLSIHKPTC